MPSLFISLVLFPTSSNVSDCIHFSPSCLQSNLSSSITALPLHHTFLLCSPSPLLPLPLPSIKFFLLPYLLFFPIQFFNLVCSQTHMFLCFPEIPLFLSSLHHWQCVSISSRTRLLFPSWGHFDLSCPFWVMTSHLFTNVRDLKDLSCSVLQPCQQLADRVKTMLSGVDVLFHILPLSSETTAQLFVRLPKM